MTLSVAFCGVGDRARPYLDALARLPDVALTAVYDSDRRAAEEVAAGWHARVFPSVEKMLQEAKPEALWVCVPPHRQSAVLARAIQQGVPFFVEPPGAGDFEQARQCGQQIADANLVTAVGFPTRCTDVVQEAHEYLGTNMVPLVLGWWLCPPREERATAATALLWDDASLLIDALRYFCGEVEQVHAVAPAEAPGGLVVQLRFVRGSVGVLTCATFARPEPRIELEMLGEGWSLSFGAGLAALTLVEKDRTTVLRRLNNPAADQVQAFLQAVTTHDPAAVVAGYGDALRTLAVCHAAAESAREGKPVKLEGG